ncbi:MAG TPA: hypothetical protein VF459_10990 [Caulobacteraceae bacterium]
MDQSFFEHHWWLVFALAALIIPVGGIFASTFTTYLHFRHRRDALDTLKAFAASGQTPPPELMEALKAQASDEVPPWNGMGADAMWGGDRYTRRAARQAMRAARWQYRAPYRRWSGAVWLAALTVGFGYASQHADPNTASAFMLTAIILGAATVGSIITALLATFMRP